jgi:RNA polymerase sigma factor (sigma-70 family)
MATYSYFQNLRNIKILSQVNKIVYFRQVDRLNCLCKVREKLRKDRFSDIDWATAAGIDLEELRKILIEGEQARKVIIEASLPLVTKLARNHLRKGVLFEDLVQEGVCGSIEALKRFDINKGYQFSTYAHSWVKEYIKRALKNRYCFKLSNDNDFYLEDRIEKTVDPIEELAKVIDLEKVFSVLTPQQVEILNLRYGLKGEKTMTRKQISQRLRLSPERLRQVEQQALMILKEHIDVDDFDRILSDC